VTSRVEITSVLVLARGSARHSHRELTLAPRRCCFPLSCTAINLVSRHYPGVPLAPPAFAIRSSLLSSCLSLSSRRDRKKGREMSGSFRVSHHFKVSSAPRILPVPRVSSRSAGQITKNVHAKLIYGAYSLRPPSRLRSFEPPTPLFLPPRSRPGIT